MTHPFSLAPAQDIFATLKSKRYAEALQQLHALPIKNAWLTLRFLHESQVPQGKSQYLRAFTQDLLYRAHRLELDGQCDDSKRIYQLLIQHNAGKKITVKARQGLKRIAETNQTKPTRSGTTRKHAPSNLTQNLTKDLSVLILKPVELKHKENLIPAFAQIMETDPYSARLQIPVRGCRLFRYGSSDELQILSQSLTTGQIPHLCISLSQIQSLPVYEVFYLSSVDENHVTAMIRQKGALDQLVPFEFEWSAVQQLVEGQLPLFEEVLVRNSDKKLARKTSTNDYAHFCDLHLTTPDCILRFYDEAYQFNKGLPLIHADQKTVALAPKTSWAQWKGLKQIFANHLPNRPILKDFNHFAETAIEQIEILAKLESNIRLCRREDSYWDQAFQLYSSLTYFNL